MSVSFPPCERDVWNGFERNLFEIDGCPAWIVPPENPLPGGKWVWSMEFPGAFFERCALPELLAKGFYVAHIVVGNTYGCPAAMNHFDAFYAFACSCGLSSRVVLQGISRGGLYAARFASAHPERVAVLYGDAPVCDIKSWPAGKGRGVGSPSDWSDLIRDYGFRDEAEALDWKGNPVDTAEILAGAHIPVIHVLGDADDVVPPEENSAVFEKRFRAAGGDFHVIHKPGIGHHPHGLEDPSEVVEFICSRWKK